MARVIGENPRSNGIAPLQELRPEDVLPVLKLEDRCDRCSQPAVCIVAAKTGFLLYFCGSHWRSLREGMKNYTVSFKSMGEGGAVVDNRESVDWKKSKASI